MTELRVIQGDVQPNQSNQPVPTSICPPISASHLEVQVEPGRVFITVATRSNTKDFIEGLKELQAIRLGLEFYGIPHGEYTTRRDLSRGERVGDSIVSVSDKREVVDSIFFSVK